MKNSNGYYLFIFLFTITFIVVGLINIANYNKIIQDRSEEAHGYSKDTVIVFKWLTLGIVILCGLILFFNLFSFTFGIGFFEWVSPKASFLSKEVEGVDTADYLYRAGAAAGEKLKPVGSGLGKAGSAAGGYARSAGSAVGGYARSAGSAAGKSVVGAFGSLIGTGDLGNIDNLAEEGENLDFLNPESVPFKKLNPEFLRTVLRAKAVKKCWKGDININEEVKEKIDICKNDPFITSDKDCIDRTLFRDKCDSQSQNYEGFEQGEFEEQEDKNLNKEFIKGELRKKANRNCWDKKFPEEAIDGAISAKIRSCNYNPKVTNNYECIKSIEIKNECDPKLQNYGGFEQDEFEEQEYANLNEEFIKGELRKKANRNCWNSIIPKQEIEKYISNGVKNCRYNPQIKNNIDCIKSVKIENECENEPYLVNGHFGLRK